MKKPLIVIRRVMVPRYLGVDAAARRLGVSKGAVSNYVSGRSVSSLSPEKSSRIKIISR